MTTFAYDFETYYSKEYSIKDLGNYGYTHHPEFNAYMVSVVGDNGYRFCGSPKDFDWKMLHGQRVIAHNAGFEFAVTERLKELGVVPNDLEFAEFYDTADLAAYCGYPRSLASASLCMLRVKVDKGPRDKAKGKKWNDMTVGFQDEMKTYALNDSVLELRLWLEYNDQWPEWERELSKLTREMCWRGIPVDLPAVEKAIDQLDTLLWKIRSRIPWASDPEAPALSPKKAAEECRKHHIEPPKSMAKDSEEFDAWLKQHGDALPWAKAMGAYRSANGFLKKLQVMRLRTKENGFMPIGLKYGGAHTLRDSGDAGFNAQNLPRDLLFADEIPGGIDMRGMICAPDGYLLGVCDLSAIEPCVLTVFAEDWELVKLLKQGMDPYEAHARTTGAWKGDLPLKGNDDELRKYEKVQVLGMGYGAGPDKTVIIAKNQMGLDLTLQQADTLVKKFRARRFIPKLWYRLERGMRKSIGETHEIELPSGRVMRYRQVRDYGGLSALTPRLGAMMRQRYWGGTLAENITQACARDVFMWHVLKLAKHGMPPILRVHDEAVCLFKEDEAEEGLKRMTEIMSTPPEWMKELPVSAEGRLCKKYKKG